MRQIKNFCQRKYNINNYKGHWSQEDEKALIYLVKEHGCKWTLISKMLQRTPENIRDKWRTLFKENAKEKVEKKCDLFSLIFQIIQAVEKLY